MSDKNVQRIVVPGREGYYFYLPVCGEDTRERLKYCTLKWKDGKQCVDCGDDPSYKRAIPCALLENGSRKIIHDIYSVAQKEFEREVQRKVQIDAQREVQRKAYREAYIEKLMEKGRKEK